MGQFQILIADGRQEREDGGSKDRAFLEPRDKVVESISELEGIWCDVVSRLQALVERTEEKESSSGLSLKEVEFNIGIEAGLSIGLVTKGDASISLKFFKKD